MKSSTRRKAIQLCEEILEKCGGPGGTPGPCPSGRGKPKPGGDPRTMGEDKRLSRVLSSGKGKKPKAGDFKVNLPGFKPKSASEIKPGHKVKHSADPTDVGIVHQVQGGQVEAYTKKSGKFTEPWGWDKIQSVHND